MQASELTESLLTAVIERDQVHLCRLLLESWRSRSTPLWLFHRWLQEEKQFRLIFPPALEQQSSLATTIKQRAEKESPWVDENDSEKYGAFPESRHYPRTLLLPVCHDSSLLGVIQGFSSRDKEACLERLSTLAPRLKAMAQSWYLLGLLEEKERLAFTDSLTGLFNSQYLLNFLENELYHCERYQKSLSVLFLDVDWFKAVNDTHGHLVGSMVLKEIGRLLSSSLRQSDVVARYGGDEFVVVLREVGLQTATRIAERLRCAIGEFQFAAKRGEPVGLTVSGGVSSFPEHGRTALELIRRADEAMYNAKQLSKNCVRIAV